MLNWNHAENLPKIEPQLAELQLLLTGMKAGSILGITQVSNDARIAYDIHQVIRYFKPIAMHVPVNLNVPEEKPKP